MLEKQSTRDQFINAVKNGDVSSVDKLLKHGVSVNLLLDKKHNTALHYAAKARNAELVELLIKHNAKLDVMNQDRETPQAIAEENQDLKTLGLLLHQSNVGKNKPSNNKPSKSSTVKVLSAMDVDIFPIKQPAKDDAIEKISMEMESKSKEKISALKIKSSLNKRELYILAVHEGNIEKIEEYLASGCSSNIVVDEMRNTGLHYAVLKNDQKLIRVLFNYHADVNFTNSSHLTCLELAAKKGLVDCVKVIAECTKITDSLYQEMLNLAVKLENEKANRNKKRLVSEANEKLESEVKKVKLNRQDFIKAIHSQDLDRIKECLENGISASMIIDHEGNTPLHFAAKKENIDLTKLLVQHNAKANRLNTSKQSAAQLAVATKNVELIMLLVNSLGQDEKDLTIYQSALELALYSKNIEQIQELATAGVSFDFLESEDGLKFFKSLIDEKENHYLLQFLFEADKSGVIDKLLIMLGTLPESLEEDLQDTISLGLLKEPIYITPCGRTYNSASILNVKKDPYSRQPLSNKDLINNKLVGKLIAYYKQPWIDINKLPPCLMDPHTNKVYKKPVVAVDGNTYEQSWLQDYLQKNTVLPGGQIQDREPYHNLVVANLISEKYANYLKEEKIEQPNDSEKMDVESDFLTELAVSGLSFV